MKSLILLAALAVFTGQTAAAPVAGTLTATFEGRTLVKLELKTDKAGISGGLSLGDVEVDPRGAVRHVGEMKESKPIFAAVQKGRVLTFSRRDETEGDRVEMRLLADGRAELRFMLSDDVMKELAAEGIPVAKPIQLTRR